MLLSKSKLAMLMLTPILLWAGWCYLMKLAPSVFAAPPLRALVRISILLLPAAWCLFNRDSTGNGFHFQSNWRRGLVVGTLAAIIYLLPLAVYRLQMQNYKLQFPSEGVIWLNWILGSPAAEELFFRVLLLGKLEAIWKTPAAIAISAFCFGLFHVPQWLMENDRIGWWLLASFLSIVGYGVVFGVLFRRTNSLWAALLPHIANNFVAIALVENVD